MKDPKRTFFGVPTNDHLVGQEINAEPLLDIWYISALLRGRINSVVIKK